MFLSLKALLTAFLVLMLIRESISCSVPEIRVKENDTMDYYVNEGMDIKLICWVQKGQSRANLSVYWQKDNKTLQPAEHPRMRIKFFRSLKINKARKEDAGFYTCVAENECGGKNALFMHLFVRESDPIKNSTPAAPKFTIKNRWLGHYLFAVPVGNSVKLDCSAEGYPRPTVKWYKDGALFLERKGGAQVRLGPWLVMKDLVPTDTGKYTCNVSNIYGWINHSYKVDVRVRVRAKPVILEVENVTTFVGGNATLLCQAFSDPMPHFKWLRWFTLYSNSTGNGTEIQKPHFEVIEQNKQNDFVTGRFTISDIQTPKRNGKVDHFSHGVTLTLVNVTKKDEGWYTCHVVNAVGYDMKQAYIIVQEETVQGDRNTSQNLGNNSKTTAIPTGDTPESKASGKEREKPGNTSGIRYPGVLIGVSVAVIFITITVSSWICWKLKRTRASSNSRPPDIDFLQARYRVQNEYVVVPNFK